MYLQSPKGWARLTWPADGTVNFAKNIHLFDWYYCSVDAIFVVPKTHEEYLHELHIVQEDMQDDLNTLLSQIRRGSCVTTNARKIKNILAALCSLYIQAYCRCVNPTTFRLVLCLEYNPARGCYIKAVKKAKWKHDRINDVADLRNLCASQFNHPIGGIKIQYMVLFGELCGDNCEIQVHVHVRGATCATTGILQISMWLPGHSLL